MVISLSLIVHIFASNNYHAQRIFVVGFLYIEIGKDSFAMVKCDEKEQKEEEQKKKSMRKTKKNSQLSF